MDRVCAFRSVEIPCIGYSFNSVSSDEKVNFLAISTFLSLELAGGMVFRRLLGEPGIGEGWLSHSTQNSSIDIMEEQFVGLPGSLSKTVARAVGLNNSCE